MRTISVSSAIEEAIVREAKSSQLSKQKNQPAITYWNNVYAYRLKIGGEITDERSEMMGSKAYELNLELRQNFAKACADAYPGRPSVKMCRWVLEDKKSVDQGRNFGNATTYRPHSWDKVEIPKGLQYE